MSSAKFLGIWMDHANANIMEFDTKPTQIKTISSKFNHHEKVKGLKQNENKMHQQEQHQQAEYYNSLGEVIKNYQKVVLFGPTSAKQELANILKADHLFENIEVEVKQSDKMTENQQHAFVNEYFK